MMGDPVRNELSCLALSRGNYVAELVLRLSEMGCIWCGSGYSQGCTVVVGAG